MTMNINEELKSTGFPLALRLAGMTEETGRSMVEMLGVLAVIGVLSVAGVGGYTSAMNQHRANEAINRAMRVAVMASSQRLLNPSAVLTDLEDGVAMGNDANNIVLTLSNIDDKVRSRIQAMGLKNADVSQGENGALVFTFSNDLSERNTSSNENTAATDYTYENCPNQFYKCEASNTCVASASDCQCPENFDTHYGCRTCENGIISYPKTQGLGLGMIEEGDCASVESNLRNPACSSKPDNFSNWGVCDGAGNCIECPAGSTSVAGMPLVPDAEHEECIAEETCIYAGLTCEQSSTPGCFLATYKSVKK